jgi:hypothetical protein
VKISKTPERRLLTLKKILTPLVVLLLLFAAAAVNIQAQNALGQRSSTERQLASNKAKALTPPTVSPATQGVINSLSQLPEADVLIYINPQRIINEVLPRVLK